MQAVVLIQCSFVILFNIVKLSFININGNEINAKIFHSLILLV